MLDVIEKLLILQDRDRTILRLRTELAKVEPERQMWKAKWERAHSELDLLKQKARQLESDRKKLELEVEAKKELIGKYSLQQFQTKKNEEYRALAHEIEGCKKAILGLEDQQLELMEQSEKVHVEIQRVARGAEDARRLTEEQLKVLEQKQANLEKDLAQLGSNREALAEVVEPDLRARYERLFKQKGENVIVGIDHGVCGGCHMKLPPQVLLSTQANRETVACPNCGRLLYYTRDMDLLAAD